MSKATNNRKIRHIRAILKDPRSDRRMYYFDDIRLRHRALPELDLHEISPSVEFMGKTLSFPLLISSMTGGDHAVLRKINQNLARAAEECGVAMAVGSQRVMFDHARARRSFELRRVAPSALLFANLGAVQLNYGFGLEQCREAVAALEADALCLHFNPLQEAVQPDGNVNFSGLAAKIGAVARALRQPIIAKEVGAGISGQDVELLLANGVRYIDVAGAGGTSWSRIEHHDLVRRSGANLGLVFQDWGIPTPTALLQLKRYQGRVTLIASGGIRSGIDMAKAMALGAALCGIAAPFLKPAMESAAAVVRTIRQLRAEFVTAMFLLGIRSARDLIGNESLLLERASADGAKGDQP
jgi:isopentenyl-diphosphate delta-isomerase